MPCFYLTPKQDDFNKIPELQVCVAEALYDVDSIVADPGAYTKQELDTLRRLGLALGSIYSSLRLIGTRGAVSGASPQGHFLLVHFRATTQKWPGSCRDFAVRSTPGAKPCCTDIFVMNEMAIIAEPIGQST